MAYPTTSWNQTHSDPSTSWTTTGTVNTIRKICEPISGLCNPINTYCVTSWTQTHSDPSTSWNQTP